MYSLRVRRTQREYIGQGSYTNLYLFIYLFIYCVAHHLLILILIKSEFFLEYYDYLSSFFLLYWSPMGQNYTLTDGNTRSSVLCHVDLWKHLHTSPLLPSITFCLIIYHLFNIFSSKLSIETLGESPFIQKKDESLFLPISWVRSSGE